MSNKDYCLQLAASTLPSKERPCPKCSNGPCLFVQPPLPRKPGRKKRPSQPLHRKTFPYVRRTESFTSQINPLVGYFAESPFSMLEEDFFTGIDYYTLESDMFLELEQITEINRLSYSRGTQVVHSKFYVHPSLSSEPGPRLIFKGVSSESSEARYHWMSVSEAHFASALTGLIGYELIESEFGIYGDLSKEVFAMDVYAFNAMRPAFKTGFSAVNFLLELDDLTKIAPSIVDSMKGLSNWFNQVGKFFMGRGHIDPTLNQLVSAVADNHLAYQFGVLPTVGDVKTICDTFARIQSNVSKWKEGVKSLGLVRHFQSFLEPLPEYKESMRRHFVLEFRNFKFEYDCVFDGFEPMPNGTPADHISYNATMEFTYTSETLGDIDPLVAALYTKLGIKPDASIIWNAIPFSFVLDWFVDVQGFLNKYASVDLITSEVTIHQWWLGLKSRPRWKCTPVSVTCCAEGLETPAIGSAPVITVYGQSYARLLHDVDVEKLVDINSETPDGLTLKRGLLSASLLKKLVFR